MGKAEAVFGAIEKALSTDGEKIVGQVKSVFLFKVKGGPTYLVDLKNGKGSCTKGGEGKADCTISISDDDFAAMAAGKLNGMQAFMQGKMKIQGNMMLAQKLQGVFASLKGKI